MWQWLTNWYRAQGWLGTPRRGYGASCAISAAVVWGSDEARHTQIGRQVALKILHPYLSHDEEMVTRLLHEAHTSNLVHHPGVVQITDHHRLKDGTTYFVMEFLAGETLRARLRRGPRLTAAEVLEVGAAGSRPGGSTRAGSHPPRPQAGNRDAVPRRNARESHGALGTTSLARRRQAGRPAQLACNWAKGAARRSITQHLTCRHL